MKKLPIDKILQSQGFGSRKYCQQLVRDQEVAWLDECGQVCMLKDPGGVLPTAGLCLQVFGEPWPYRERVYIALNKPANYECSRKPSHHPGVLKLLPEQFTWRDVQAVGRLDHDTTGLLLLTDDGQFNHAMSSPKRHVPKIYWARTFDPVDEALISTLLSGVQLHDEPAPLAVQSCRKLDAHTLEVVLDQGKYHQVKRMLAAAGNHCQVLERVAIGQLRLVDLGLAVGQWCYLDAAQLELLK